jgi:hypothetical protein
MLVAGAALYHADHTSAYAIGISYGLMRTACHQNGGYFCISENGIAVAGCSLASFSLICVLDSARCPTAVTFAVATIIVDAVKSKSWWTLTHVSKELAKVSPSRVYAYSPPRVLEVVLAPVQHLLPGFVGSTSETASRVTVFVIHFCILYVMASDINIHPTGTAFKGS